MCGKEDAVVVKNLSHRYDGNVALVNVSFALPKGSFTAVIGPNGAGKSTLIKALIGLIKYSEGYVRVYGFDPLKDPESVRKIVGYMPQRESISMHIPLRVRDVVLMGRAARKRLGVLDNRDVRIAKSALEIVGLESLWDERFVNLSGGQQQRVLLARALAVEPKMLILDEPFSAVDVPSMEKITETIEIMRRERNMTVLIVVHDVNPVLHYLDYVILLNKRLVAFGEPHEALNENALLDAYGSVIRIIVCEEGYCHPLIGDRHA